MMLENRRVIEIFSGQLMVTAERDLVISTILGSCVAVCLFDRAKGIAGMNHFVLPMDLRSGQRKESEEAWQSGNYGLPSLEQMLAELTKLGTISAHLEAKIFGGARVIETYYTDISQANVDFAESYLEKKGIPIVSRDVGGTQGRKIFFDLRDYEVYVRSLSGVRQQVFKA